MNLEFVNHSSTRIPVQYISHWMSHVEKQLIRRKVITKAEGRNLTLVFLEGREAKKLNLEHRGLNYPTDVLSFQPLSRDYVRLGELVFCVPLVKEQAKRSRHSYRDELAYLVLHGLLHLLGFQHENGGTEAKLMYALQDSLFIEIQSFRES